MSDYGYSSNGEPDFSSADSPGGSGSTTDRTVIPCPVGECKRTYTNDGSLRNHLRMVHNDRHMLPQSHSRSGRRTSLLSNNIRKASPSSPSRRLNRAVRTGSTEALAHNPSTTRATSHNVAIRAKVTDRHPLLNAVSLPDLWLYQTMGGGDLNNLNDNLTSSCSPLLTSRHMLHVDNTVPFGTSPMAPSGFKLPVVDDGPLLLSDVPLPPPLRWHARISNSSNTNTAAPELRSVCSNNNNVSSVAHVSSSPATLRELRSLGSVAESRADWSNNLSSPLTMVGRGESSVESATRRLHALAEFGSRIAVHADEVLHELYRTGANAHGSSGTPPPPSIRTANNSPRPSNTPRARSSSLAAPYRRDILHMSPRRYTDPLQAQALHDELFTAAILDHALSSVSFTSPTTALVGVSATYGADSQCDQLLLTSMDAAQTAFRIDSDSLHASPNNSLASDGLNTFNVATPGVHHASSPDLLPLSLSDSRVDFNTHHDRAPAEHEYLHLTELWQLVQQDTLDTLGTSDMMEYSSSSAEQSCIGHLATALRNF